MTLKLVIANKNYSSWSMRPWLAMRMANIAFEEELISLDDPGFKLRVEALGSGKVPVLLDGEISVWESLAILEYLAEKFPSARLWPVEPAARARARAVSAEMHAGFIHLRRQLPMNMRRPVQRREVSPEVKKDVLRIENIWTDCHRYAGAAGPFLFGEFGAADAMFAPVVSRFHTYAVEVRPAARSYMDAVMALAAWNEWHAGAVVETAVLPEDEVDWPLVPGLRVTSPRSTVKNAAEEVDLGRRTKEISGRSSEHP
jgi:glutathione S-transferase